MRNTVIKYSVLITQTRLSFPCHIRGISRQSFCSKTEFDKYTKAVTPVTGFQEKGKVQRFKNEFENVDQRVAQVCMAGCKDPYKTSSLHHAYSDNYKSIFAKAYIAIQKKRISLPSSSNKIFIRLPR